MKNSNGTIGKGTRDLPIYSAVPQRGPFNKQYNMEYKIYEL
jgi:hypothetical protein